MAENLEEKDRVNLLLAATQVMAPALSDNQIRAVAAAIFEALGVTLPAAPAMDPVNALEIVGS